MNLNLSWDLFILVFFGVIVAYSFIIGRNQTLKVILGTYVAILCADSLGNLFSQYFVSSKSFLSFLKLFSITSPDQAVVFFKVSMFIFLIVMIAVKGFYDVSAHEDDSATIRILSLMILAILSAGLILSTVILFVSGVSLIGGETITANLLGDLYGNSRFVQLMMNYSNAWFFLPGLTIIGMGILKKN